MFVMIRELKNKRYLLEGTKFQLESRQTIKTWNTSLKCRSWTGDKQDRPYTYQDLILLKYILRMRLEK